MTLRRRCPEYCVTSDHEAREADFRIMKTFQMRLADEIYEAIKEIADERRTTVADVIREGLEAYAIGAFYAREGRSLFWEDPRTGERAEVMIPGFTFRRLRERVLTSEEAR